MNWKFYTVKKFWKFSITLENKYIASGIPNCSWHTSQSFLTGISSTPARSAGLFWRELRFTKETAQKWLVERARWTSWTHQTLFGAAIWTPYHFTREIVISLLQFLQAVHSYCILLSIQGSWFYRPHFDYSIHQILQTHQYAILILL